MADNVVANAGAGGATFATDEEVGVAHHPYVKLEWGADNTFTKVASGASAVPIQDGGNSITVDGAVSLAAALPAGTNNIGDVDVLSVVPGTGATALGKAEDAAHTTADTGVAVLAVRRDTVAVGSDTDGDYSTLNVNAGGRLYTVSTVDAPLPAGTNNIGDVDVLSLPASTKTIKRAVGNVSTSGDNTAIAAPGASKVLKVISFALQGHGTVNAKFTDGVAGSALTLTWNFQAREGAYAQPTVIPQFHFKCTVNTALILNLSAAVECGFEITYWDDDAS